MPAGLWTTLANQISADDAEWRSSNEVRRQISHGLAGRVLAFAAAHPLASSLIVLDLSIIFSSVLVLRQPESLLAASQQWRTGNLNEHFAAVWTVQAALAAFIYPIVIAFVSLLIQRSRSAKAVLYIYLHESAGMLAALNALFLVALMTAQSMILNAVDASTAIGWLLLDGAWLLLNLVLTSVFLYRTFEFVRPASRAATVRRYVLEWTLPADIRRHLGSHLFATAVSQGFVPGPAYGDNPGSNEPSVWLGPFGRGSGNEAVRYRLKARSVLTDVRFRPLRVAVSRWAKAVHRRRAMANIPGATNLPSSRSDAFTLVLPLNPGTSYAGDISLARVIGGVPVPALSRLLIRWSFKFRRASDRGFTIEDVLNESQMEVRDALASRQSEALATAVEELIGLYCDLIRASAFRDTSGAWDNYSRLPHQEFSISRPLHELWIRSLTDLFHSAVRLMDSDHTLLTEFIDAPGTIFGRLRSAHSDVLKYVLRLPQILFYRMGTWWLETARRGGVEKIGRCHSTLLAGASDAAYQSVLLQFVGQWEQSKNHSIMASEGEPTDWAAQASLGELLALHVETTCLMLIDAVNRGDRRAAEWMLDVLLKWFSELEFRLGSYTYVFRHENVASLDILQLPWEEVKVELGLGRSGYADDATSAAAFAVSLKNYWTDVCCALAYWLTLSGKDCPCESSLPALLLQKMLWGRPMSGDTHALPPDRPVQSSRELFTALMRQHYASRSLRQQYTGRLDALSMAFGRESRQEVVSGRIYSGEGISFESFQDPQVLLLAVLAAGEAKLSEFELPAGGAQEEGEELELLIRRLKKWSERLGAEELRSFQGLFSCITEGRPGKSFDESAADVRGRLDRLATQLESRQEETIRALPISGKRLSKIEEWSSRRAFSVETGAFPLPLFRSLKPTSADLDERSVALTSVPKAQFTDPVMTQLAVNEQEWYAAMIQGYVAASVMDAVINALKVRDEEAGSADLYWEHVGRYSEESRNRGGRAVLVVPQLGAPWWVQRWLRNPRDEGPTGLRASRDASVKAEGYLGHLNEIGVYRAPISPGTSLLVTAEAFEAVTFTKNPAGSYVTAHANVSETDPLKVDLVLSWRLAVRMGPYAGVRLRVAPERGSPQG